MNSLAQDTIQDLLSHADEITKKSKDLIAEIEHNESRRNFCNKEKERLSKEANTFFKKYYKRLLNEALPIDGDDWFTECQDEISKLKREFHEFRMATLNDKSFLTDISFPEERVAYIDGILDIRLHISIFGTKIYEEK